MEELLVKLNVSLRTYVIPVYKKIIIIEIAILTKKKLVPSLLEPRYYHLIRNTKLSEAPMSYSITLTFTLYVFTRSNVQRNFK